MNSSLRLFLLAMAVALAFGVDDDLISRPHPHGSSWDFMVFSQQWPQTVCTAWKDRSSANECSEPKDVSHWSVHGLWPSVSSGEGPQFCNRSWAFNMTELESILTELEEHWPNIYKGTSLASFWEHEWTKHGTCAASDPPINSELKYFSTGLQLANKYNLFAALQAANIMPNPESSYQLDDINQVFLKSYNIDPTITCYRDKETKRYLIKEIRVCLAKDLSLIKCPEPSKNMLTDDEGCSKDGVVYYPPIVPTVFEKKTEL